MIVAKIILLFSPLLLLANAQGGGRFGFFSRPDFRRPRPWERPTVAPVPDTPMPTEKVIEHITSSPKARTELTTPTPVRTNFRAPVSSAPRFSSRGRVWGRRVFGSRPTAMTTPASIALTESITLKSDNHSAVVSAISQTTESESPAIDYHAKYKDRNNFNSGGRYSPQYTHNTEEIQSDTIQTTTAATTKLPSSTTESAGYTITPSTYIPFIDELKTYDNIYLSTQTPIPFKIVTTEIATAATDHITSVPELPRTTTQQRTAPIKLEQYNPITTTRVPFVDLQKKYDFTSPPPVKHTNVYEKTTEAPSTSDAPIYPVYHHETDKVSHYEEFSSATREPEGYTVPTTTKIPFIDVHKTYDVDVTSAPPVEAIINREKDNPINQENQNDGSHITSKTELPQTTTRTAPIKREQYNPMITTRVPFVDLQKKYDLTSPPPVEYTNVYEKTTEAPSTSDAPIYPVYHHETDKVSHYEEFSSATREPEAYTVPTTTKIPFIDVHKTYDVDVTSAPAVEFTNGYDRTSGMPNSDESDDGFSKIYPNNYKENRYGQTMTPKVVTTTKSTLHKSRHPKTTTEAALTQTIRHTNSYRYVESTSTKPTTHYTSTPLRTSHVNKVYDIDNFKCKDENGYYSISNQCDEFIECKSGIPIQNTCPDGLHFNPAAIYSEYPCAFPSEVKCESNSVIRQPEPTSQCPRRFGYFSMKDGSCDKYIICQGGLATVMSCPPGLAFRAATSSCDWPANVPDCVPDIFEGFTCPAPELNEDGLPTQSLYKYRYDKSCKKYIACQKGHPRLLSCDSGLAFDKMSESCIDEFDVNDCT